MDGEEMSGKIRCVDGWLAGWKEEQIDGWVDD